jgi:hypothetical protein
MIVRPAGQDQGSAVVAGVGTGLGLSLSWIIVQKHHGTLTVRSQVGEGTVFRLILPIDQPDRWKVGAGDTAPNSPGVLQHADGADNHRSTAR